MQTQLLSIIENFQNIETDVVTVDHLTETLKTSFDKSTANAKSCYYLDSIINIIRKETHLLKQKIFSFSDELFQYVNTDNEKISSP